MEPIKVAYICTPIDFGGAEKVSLNFLRNIDRDSFAICPIFLIRPWEEKPLLVRLTEEAGYPPLFVPVGRKPQAGFLRIVQVAWQLASILRKGRFDLVHTHGYFADICTFSIAKFFRTPMVATCHGYISHNHKLRLYNKLDKYILRLSSAVIAVSVAMKTDLVYSGIENSKVVVVPNAVTAELNSQNLQLHRDAKRNALAFEPKDFVVGYLGRLSEEKGVKFLIEAISECQKKSYSLKLVIVGDGPERPTLEKLVQEHHLESEVIFAGFQANTEQWLSVLDLFVLPSLTEGTPMALLEAMAVGIPVVASAVGGVPLVVEDGVNGLLVPPCRADLLAEKIELLINDHELLKSISSNARNHIEKKYEVGRWCRTIEQIYRDVIAARY